MVIRQARIEEGRIVLPDVIALPDGTEVLISIEVLNGADEVEDDLSKWPTFGMWADRPEMQDSLVWVRSQRARWQRHNRTQD